MTQRDKGVPCALCGFGPDTGIHLPALTGPRKGLPYGHEYYGPHVVVLQDPPLNVHARMDHEQLFCQSRRKT
jgi:hypothetical protein